MDRDALQALVKSHQAEIYRYLRYLGMDSASAQDLAQDTFVAAFRSSLPGSIAGDKAAAAWLRGIARNMVLRHRRRAGRNPVKADSGLLERAEDVWTVGFAREADGLGHFEALRACLEELPEKQRRVIELRYIHKRSREEMAHVFEMSKNGVKSLLRRTRASLADCIRKRLGSERE